jgi:O-succinylbenzoate synthase
MRIAKIAAYKLEIPMYSSYVTSFGTIDRKPTVVVEVETDDGVKGWGEAAALSLPVYNAETVDTCMLAIKNYLAPFLLGPRIESIMDAMEKIRHIKGHHIAKAGLETALWMIFSLIEGKSLSTLLGGSRKKIAVGESIGIKASIDELIEEISLRLFQGFQRIKIKIQPGWDINVLDAVRRVYPTTPLMVDANSSYTLQDMKMLKKFDNYHLTMIEQPLAADDIIDHAVLQKAIDTPICLDESILSVEDARKAISLGACKVINIKPSRVGGLLESQRIHDICQASNVGVWCGGMMETGLGKAFNIALSSLSGFVYAADMSPAHFYFVDDIVDGGFLIDEKGWIEVPDLEGLGFRINEEKIQQYTVEKFCECTVNNTLV